MVASLLSWKGYRYELMFINSWGFSFKPALSGLISEGLSEWAGGIWYPLEFYQGIKLITNSLEIYSALSFITNELGNNRPVILNIDTYWCPWHEYYQKTSRPHSVIILGIDDKNHTLDCIDKYTWQLVQGPCKMSYNDFLNGYQSVTIMSFDKAIAEIEWRKIIREAVQCMKGRANYDVIYLLKKGNFVKRVVLALKLAQFKLKKFSCFDEIKIIAQKIDESNLENERQTDIPFERNPLLIHFLLVSHGRKKFAYMLKYLGEELQVQSLLYLSNLMFNVAWHWEDEIHH